MKISKLFHWLYGILMLLPILVFLPNAFYYGFNEQAISQEKTEQVPVYYETNEVNSVDDLIDGNYYTITYKNVSNNTGNIYYYEYKVISYSYSETFTPSAITDYLRSTVNSSNLNTIYTYSSSNNSTTKLYTGFTIDFRYKDNPNNNLTNLISNGAISICNRNYSYIKTIETNMSITDSMSYAWDSVWQNDLFSWSYESFLAEPFKYIGNVFGLPNDNSIYYCLSYWLDISIIWLCFDLIMYVPLLVHRWIDKGVLE